MNILVTLNRGYLEPLMVMLRSLTAQHGTERIEVYVAHSSLLAGDLDRIRRVLESDWCSIHEVKVDGGPVRRAPVTNRYPREMYYRIFAAQYLPRTMRKVLYLDPDIVVINPVRELYQTDLGDCLFAAASHVQSGLLRLNRFRLDLPENGPYINSGVMLMNLTALRREQRVDEVTEYIRKRQGLLWLPDQDVISALYGHRILTVDPLRYNLNERYFVLHNLNLKNIGHRLTLDWVRRNTSIIHYCGRNKPWKDNYVGVFDLFYREYAQPEPRITGMIQKAQTT